MQHSYTDPSTSEARLRRLDGILQMSPAVVYCAEAGGDFGAAFVSERIKDQLGYEPQEFISDPAFWVNGIHPEDRQRILDGLSSLRLFEHGKYVHEYRFRHKDGHYVWMRDEMHLILDDQGKPKEIAGYWIDITARRNMEDELKDARDRLEQKVYERTQELNEANERLKSEVFERERIADDLREQDAFRRAIIDSAADGLCVCHEIPEYPNVEFTVWNSRMNEITGYTLEEINQLGWYQTVYPDPEVRDRAIERMSRMRTGDNMLAEEWTITRHDGRRRTVMISTSIISGHGSQAHVLALMRDVTEQKAAEDERRRLEEKMKSVQKLESLGVLAGGIAHDLNNLLMGVLGNADLAMMELSPRSPVLGFLTNIKTTAVRMAEIANQMLAYSGKGRFVVAPLNLSDLVTEMAELLHVSLRKNINLQLDLMSDLPAIEADSSQIRQVVMNLITNAADAIDKGGGVISLRTGIMSADRTSLAQFPWNQEMPEGNYVYLEVSDTGCGMIKEVMEKIFDPFFTTKTSGRGLGLAAVQGIVRGHKGSIKVYSEPGKGTIFSVLFPCSETASSPGIRQSTDNEIPHGESKTILVVDDEETVRTVAAAMLQKAGFKVLTAVDGVEALSVLRAHGTEIDVVLLDMTMPNMGGFETFNEIRRITADLPVILCSGYNEQEATKHFTAKGLADFIKKPYDIHTLTKKVVEVIARGSTQDDSGQG